jgi:hypothetical protein
MKNLIQSFIKKLWNSPTFTTWGSFFASSINFVVVLPLLLTQLSVEEITVWYLFKLILGLRTIADFGVGVTFTRVIAYAMGGVSNLNNIGELDQPNHSDEPNLITLRKIIDTMNGTYLVISTAIFLIVISLGSLSLLQPISRISEPGLIWFAWFIVIVSMSIAVNGNKFTSILQGMNQIPLYRRWETFFTIMSIITSFTILVLKGNLATLVFGTQIWIVLNVFMNKYLCQKLVVHPKGPIFKTKTINPEVFSIVWPRAWKSGTGQFMSYGLTQISGLVYAQVGNPGDTAAYLLGLQFMNAIVGIAKAPFYTKIPLLSRLFSAGKRQELLKHAKRGITQAHWFFVIGFSGVGIFAPYLLTAIKSNASFPDSLLWTLIGIGFFSERYGAMHLQLYSITNHIVWHIANGVSGIIYLIISITTLNSIGVYAFPIGYIGGYLGFYAWYCARKSYKFFGFDFWKFERSTFLAPLFLFVVIIVFQYFS